MINGGESEATGGHGVRCARGVRSGRVVMGGRGLRREENSEEW